MPRAFTAACLLLCLALVVAAPDFGPVDQVLKLFIANRTFPGCIAAVADASGLLYYRAMGSFTYGEKPPHDNRNMPVVNDTLWDMASLTKVLMTTTAVMTLYQRGELDLDMAVSDPLLLGPGFAQAGKGTVTVRHLLLHSAGFPGDPTPHEYFVKAFGCPGMDQPTPPSTFACQQRVFDAVLAQVLIAPVGAQFLYSDLSFITLAFVVGARAQALGYITPAQLDPECAAGSQVRHQFTDFATFSARVSVCVGYPGRGFRLVQTRVFLL